MTEEFYSKPLSDDTKHCALCFWDFWGSLHMSQQNTSCNTCFQFQHCPIGVSTHLLLLFFLLGAFLIGITGQAVPRLALGFGVLVILGALAGLIGGSSSSIFRCFSFSTFFFFFLSFFSFFFLGLTMGPWESAVSCSCTAFNWREKI